MTFNWKFNLKIVPMSLWLRSIVFFLLSLITAEVSAQSVSNFACSHVKQRFKASHARAVTPALDQYDVKFYFLDIEADNLSSTIKANVKMIAATTETMPEFVIQLSDALQVDSVFIND